MSLSLTRVEYHDSAHDDGLVLCRGYSPTPPPKDGFLCLPGGGGSRKLELLVHRLAIFLP